jgi:hypothetical protein
MDDILLRPIFRSKYVAEQKSKNKFNQGGLANLQKFSEGGLTRGERTAMTLAPFVQALTGAQTRPGETQMSGLARAFGVGLGGLGEAKKNIAVIDQVEVDRLKNKNASKNKAQEAQDKLEAEFRNTWRNSKIVKNFEDAQGGYNRVVAGATQDSKAGDIALIFGFMKTLDPTSVVRESEFSLGENVGSMSDKVKAYYDSFKGKGRLTPKMRQELLQASTNQFGTYQTELDTFKSDFGKKAKQFGFDANRTMLTADRRPSEIELNGKRVQIPLGTRIINTKKDLSTGRLVSTYEMPDGTTFRIDVREVF